MGNETNCSANQMARKPMNLKKNKLLGFVIVSIPNYSCCLRTFRAALVSDFTLRLPILTFFFFFFFFFFLSMINSFISHYLNKYCQNQLLPILTFFFFFFFFFLSMINSFISHYLNKYCQNQLLLKIATVDNNVIVSGRFFIYFH